MDVFHRLTGAELLRGEIALHPASIPANLPAGKTLWIVAREGDWLEPEA